MHEPLLDKICQVMSICPQTELFTCIDRQQRCISIGHLQKTRRGLSGQQQFPYDYFRYIGIPPCFLTATKGENFCDFLHASVVKGVKCTL